MKANAQNIIDAIEAAGATNARYGVANYQDFGPRGCPYGFELDTDLTGATAAKMAITPGPPETDATSPRRACSACT